MSREEMMSLLETIGETGYSNTHLYTLLRIKKIPGEKDSNGHWWIPRSVVESLKKKKEA